MTGEIAYAVNEENSTQALIARACSVHSVGQRPVPQASLSECPFSSPHFTRKRVKVGRFDHLICTERAGTSFDIFLWHDPFTHIMAEHEGHQQRLSLY